jgi:hypothetical protein
MTRAELGRIGARGRGEGLSAAARRVATRVADGRTNRDVAAALFLDERTVATFYLANDPTCSPRVVPTGSGFVDEGNDTHVVRNAGSQDLVTVVVSLMPAGQERRIDQLAPDNCGVF